MNNRRLRNGLLFGVAIWIAMLPPPVRAATPVQGRSVGAEPIDAVLMEDHSDSFVAWRKAAVKNRTIVHIDSHIDLEWVSGPDLKRILALKTAGGLKETQLDPLHPEERSSKPLSIMNFLYPAITEGMAKELYWVVPDSLMSGTAVLDKMKSHLIETLDRLSIDDLSSFRIEKGVIKGRVYHIPLTICTLSDLPRFKEAVLLDIDVDYFDPPDLGKRLDIPSLWPEEFITRLMEKGIRSDSVTISYSVKGGYLALEYKFLGEDLANLLKDPGGRNPDLARIREHRRSGFIFRSKGMYAEAVDEFRKGLELSPDDAALHYGLGLVYAQWGKAEEASVELGRAKTIDGTYEDPVRYDADYYFQKGMFDRALPLYEGVLKKDPGNLEALLGAGLASSKLGKLEKAAEYYQNAIEKSPNFYLAHFNLGVVYSQLEQVEKAEREYRRALDLNPYFGKAYQNLGGLYANRGERDKAIGAFEKAVENNPCFKGAQNNLGSLYASSGRLEEGGNAFKKAVRIDPRYATGFSNLGKIYLMQEKTDEALKAFQQALSIDSKNVTVRYSLGRLYTMTGRYTEAIASYEGVIALDPSFYPAYVDLAKILGEKEIDLNRAVTLIREAIDLKPAAQAYGLLAWLYIKQGKDKEADEAIGRGLQLDPGDESLVRLRDNLRRR